MLNITLTPEIREKLKSLLIEENNEDALVRIREVKAGTACKSHIELRLSIDELNELEDEEELTVEGIPFVVTADVIDTYGSFFSISLCPESGQPKVSTPNGIAAPSCCGTAK
jgi:Fe-S cluster assembly iron-binding protein IscA